LPFVSLMPVSTIVPIALAVVLAAAAPVFASAEPGAATPVGDLTGLILTGCFLLASVASVGILKRRGILAPDAFTPPKRIPERVGWGVWALGAFAIFMAASIGGQLALAGVSDGSAVQAETMTLRTTGAFSIGYALAGTMAATIIIVGLNRRSTDLGFRVRGMDLLLGLLATAGALPVVLLTMSVAAIVHGLLSEAPPDPLAHETLRLMSESPGSLWWWVTTASVVVGVPILEELLFRGFAQSAFVSMLRNRWVAIVVTSLIFAWVHAGIADVRALPGLFTLGVALGIAFERTGRIGVPIVMHALFNALNSGIALLA